MCGNAHRCTEWHERGRIQLCRLMPPILFYFTLPLRCFVPRHICLKITSYLSPFFCSFALYLPDWTFRGSADLSFVSGIISARDWIKQIQAGFTLQLLIPNSNLLPILIPSLFCLCLHLLWKVTNIWYLYLQLVKLCWDCLFRLQTNLQISDSYRIHFHIWRRPDSNLTISKLVRLSPACTFML